MNRQSFMVSGAAGLAALATTAQGQNRAKGRNKGKAAPEAPATIKPMLGGLQHPTLKISIRNLKTFFTGTSEEQLEQCAAWGAVAYENILPGDSKVIKAKADSLGLGISVAKGAGGIKGGGMVNPADHASVIAQFKTSVAKGKEVGAKTYLCLTGSTRDDATIAQQTGYVIECLKRLNDICEAEDVDIVVETLNALVNHKGYFMTTTPHTMEIMEGVDSPRIKMLFDIYHQQITEGNVIRNLTQNIDRIGHFHFADNPGRKEPGTGELNYTNIFKAIAATDYDRYVATEFSPIDRSPDGKIRALNAVAKCLDWV